MFFGARSVRLVTVIVRWIGSSAAVGALAHCDGNSHVLA